MSDLVVGTTAIRMDEPCMGVSELNLQSPGWRGFRRYQIIRVMRNDAPVEMRRDLGPAESYAVEEFRIPGGVQDDTTGRFWIEHTVGELVDIADYLRAGAFARPVKEPDDLIQRYYDNIDVQKAARTNRSMVGPAVTIQRS